MKRGKQTCRILKEIRRQIAEANDIEYITSECQYQGDCLGTCPKCESEVRYLEQQLERRRMAGKAIMLVGLSTGMLAMNAQTVEETPASPDTPQTVSNFTPSLLAGKVLPQKQTSDRFLITGTVVYDTNEPVVGASVSEKGTTNGTLTDSIGNFSLRVSGNDPLVVQYIGCKTQEIKTNKHDSTRLQIVLQTEEELMGESPIIAHSTPLPPETEACVTDSEALLPGVIEKMPQFPGGNKALLEFFNKNIRYPASMKSKKITGRVIVQFTIDKDGKVTNPQIARSLHPLFDKEVLRVTKQMPAWNPGTILGKPISTKFTVPVTFALP